MVIMLEEPKTPAGPLRRGTVRLRWQEPLPDKTSQFAAWWSLLGQDERDRAARCRHDEDRHAYVAAHALKRSMLAEATGLGPSALCWTRGPAGKPELHPGLGFPELRFNISHSRGLVACGLTVIDDIGVDVEAVTRTVDTLDLALQNFSREEFTTLATLPAREREMAFLRLWTLKEAFVKATGAGLSFGLANFSMQLDPIGLASATREAGPVESWRFLQLQPVPGHVLAVATRCVPPARPVAANPPGHTKPLCHSCEANRASELGRACSGRE